MIAVHLNHPCSEIDVCEVSEQDFALMKNGQGYVSLQELRELTAERDSLAKQLAFLEKDYDRERKAMIEAERINVILNQQMISVLVDKNTLERERAAFIVAVKELNDKLTDAYNQVYYMHAKYVGQP